MFKENQPGTETQTIIGPTVKVEGDFITDDNVIVQGVVCGTIKTSKNLKVGQKSKIFANIQADNAIISGEIQGNIKINGKLELTPTAKIFGDIKAEVLIVSSGSILNGKCQMGTSKDKSAKPDFSKQEKIKLEQTTTQAPQKTKKKEEKKK